MVVNVLSMKKSPDVKIEFKIYKIRTLKENHTTQHKVEIFIEN